MSNDCVDCKVKEYCKEKESVIACFGKADYEKFYEQGRTDERPIAFGKGYDSGYQQGRADERAKVIDEIIHKCSKEYQAWSDDTVCKIWLRDLEQLKEH